MSAVNPKTSFLYVNDNTDSYSIKDIVELLYSCLWVTLGWLVTATMFQLTISIREIFNLVSESHAKCYKIALYLVSIIFCTLQILALVLVPVFFEEKNDIRQRKSIFVHLVAYLTLTVMQSVILSVLISTLKRMRKFATFSRKNILTQFILFLVSFITKICAYAGYLVWQKPLTETWVDLLVLVCLYMPFSLVPITFMLYNQHRTFKVEERMRAEKTASFH